jgi:hypothetical protein
MNQLRSRFLIRISLDASVFSGRHPLHFPLACHSSLLALILFLLVPPYSIICAFFACLRPLSTCTIMDMIGAVSNSVCLSDIQTPNRWHLVPLRAP